MKGEIALEIYIRKSGDVATLINSKNLAARILAPIIVESYIEEGRSYIDLGLLCLTRDQKWLAFLVNKVFPRSISKEALDSGITHACGVSKVIATHWDTEKWYKEKIRKLTDAVASRVKKSDLFDAINVYLKHRTAANRSDTSEKERVSDWVKRNFVKVFQTCLESNPYFLCAVYIYVLSMTIFLKWSIEKGSIRLK